jgi:phenylalanyl-tRNA synthetase alpha chain
MCPDAVRGVTVQPLTHVEKECHMSTTTLSAEAVRRALSIRDLTDPAQGRHAIQQLIDACVAQLAKEWRCATRVHRASPIISTSDNYDRLGYPPEGVARDARYTRYVCDVAVLRTQTSAMIPPLLSALSEGDVRDVLLVCPGLVYRRDCIDRLHTGEPHQLDLWRIRKGTRLGPDDLESMLATVVNAVVPGRQWRAVRAEHPYTVDGLQVDVRDGSSWIEIGECGLAHPSLLAASHLGDHSGLAMGLGLDRLLMMRKGIDDIRLLRTSDPRIASQMLDLEPYRPVSSMPPVRRDLSIVVRDSTAAEELGDRVRAALGDDANAVETVEVTGETSYASLPPAARARLRMTSEQKNVVLRVVLRDISRTLTHGEANELRDAIYAAVHEGETMEWASSGPTGVRK